MGGNTIGTVFRLTTFGESHGAAIGGVVDGMPPGIEIDTDFIQQELHRRRPGQSSVTTPRKEPDAIEFLSGVFEGKSTGTPIGFIIQNSGARSSDYSEIKDIFRPGHADYTYRQKYGLRDYRGGGRASGRETAARVAGGALAKLILYAAGISITAYTIQAGHTVCRERDLSAIEKNPMRACDLKAAEEMGAAVEKAAAEGDSIGGIVECSVRGVPPGLGEPVFEKLDARLAAAVLSVGGIKGIEFGGGFRCAEATGSSWNDAMESGTGSIGSDTFMTNNAGGVLGGISTGQNILFRAAVKPTPSIAKQQHTVSVTGEDRTISIKGRHDPCLCPRIVPVIEGMTALVLADLYLAAKQSL